jgi:hypothetical protein
MLFLIFRKGFSIKKYNDKALNITNRKYKVKAKIGELEKSRIEERTFFENGKINN